jgi:hypothetical protein
MSLRPQRQHSCGENRPEDMTRRPWPRSIQVPMGYAASPEINSPIESAAFVAVRLQPIALSIGTTNSEKA